MQVDVMIESIGKYFPKGTGRTFPDGGLFTWAEYVGGGKVNNSMRISLGRVADQSRNSKAGRAY